jgi:integrase
MTKATQSGLKRGEGTIQDRPNGRAQARWMERQPDGSAIRRHASFPNRGAAEAHLRQVALDVYAGTYVAPSQRTVRDVIADWLERGAARWKPGTYAAYRQRADNHVIPSLGAIKVDALTTPRVQHWVDGLQKAGLDAATIDNVSRILSGALREAVQIGVLARNPATGVRRPPVRSKEPPTWTAAEIARVMSAIGEDPMWHALYRVALSTGMRPGELRALSWPDVQLAAGSITIRRTLSKDKDGRVVMGETTKTGRSRQVAIPPTVVKALKSWEVAQKERRIAAPVWHDDGIVFDRGDGRWLPLSTWQRFHRELCEAAGVTRITFHALRHTSATIALESGEHPLVVSRRLGHRSITTTLDVYSHVSTDMNAAAAQALEAHLFGDADATTSTG